MIYWDNLLSNAGQKIASRMPHLVESDGRWASQVAMFLLWFEYLAVSPSYELARRFRAGELTNADKAKLPVDFDAVLSVYDDLGDVQRVRFEDWWLETAIRFFGHKGAKPKVTGFGVLRCEAPDPKATLQEKAATYVDSYWQAEGRQTSVVAAIPVGLSKAQIARQVNQLLEHFPAQQRTIARDVPKYQLVKRRAEATSLNRYLLCVWLKAALPKMSLWRIGALASLSNAYSSQLDPKAKMARHEKTDERYALKILTSRAINRGMMIAENAARGIFPRYVKCPNAVKPDWVAIGAMVEARRSWED